MCLDPVACLKGRGGHDCWPVLVGDHQKGTAMEEFEKLKKLVAEAEDDIKKAEGGNKAAGTRARQTMQDIKNNAQNVREKILELRNAGEQKQPS